MNSFGWVQILPQSKILSSKIHSLLTICLVNGSTVPIGPRQLPRRRMKNLGLKTYHLRWDSTAIWTLMPICAQIRREGQKSCPYPRTSRRILRSMANCTFWHLEVMRQSTTIIARHTLKSGRALPRHLTVNLFIHRTMWVKILRWCMPCVEVWRRSVNPKHLWKARMSIWACTGKPRRFPYYKMERCC